MAVIRRLNAGGMESKSLAMSPNQNVISIRKETKCLNRTVQSLGGSTAKDIQFRASMIASALTQNHENNLTCSQTCIVQL